MRSQVDSVWHRAKDRADAGQASKRSPIGVPPHLVTSAATARSAKAKIAESEYCSRFPVVIRIHDNVGVAILQYRGRYDWQAGARHEISDLFLIDVDRAGELGAVWVNEQR